MLTERCFDSREDASTAAARHIEHCIRHDLATSDQVRIVVPGGSTPAQCFDLLSRTKLDWPRVQLLLSDERWVPNDHPDSNEKLLRQTLCVNRAAEAEILPIYQHDLSVDERCDSLQRFLPRDGFACSLLGMGADGHFASLFPDADCLQAGLDRHSERFYIPVRTTASPHARVSMSLAAILRSKELILLFYGDEKRAVFERAKSGADDLPVTALLQQTDVPITLYWAPQSETRKQ